MSNLLHQRAPWYEDAACQNTDTEAFFLTTRGGDVDVSLALKVCARCPVRPRCLQEALKEESANLERRYGIRGGKTANQRRQLQKNTV